MTCRKSTLGLLILFLFTSCISDIYKGTPPNLRISDNKRFIETENGDPFFWLGDTGWLLFTKLTREETEKYLEDRPLVPVWGSNVRAGLINREQAKKYAAWIAQRYHDRKNVIWVNGGDVRGSDSTAIWNIIGYTIKQTNKDQLITYHPFGRTQSSEWFHNEPWLDFNMFQSGHRRYDQDTTGLAYGEDNWKYANADYSLIPHKPSLDGEPSYEGIPQGLHDITQPFWSDKDMRRYAYWSVFAGCCGFTYGHSSIMQFYRQQDNPDYGAKEHWDVAINAPGASQMKHLKQLILSKPYFERVPANDLLAAKQGEKYDYIVINRGNDYLFAYTCNGSDISIDLNKLKWPDYKASWFDPRNGAVSETGISKNDRAMTFDPPGTKQPGNDRVLILEKN